MPAIAAQILDDLLAALSGAEHFDAVTIGPGSSNRFPRAELTLRNVEPLTGDGPAEGCRLRVSLCLYAHCPGPAESLGQILSLVDSAQQDLLADRFRNGLCRDLPAGVATEFGPVLLEPPCRAPLIAASFEIRCHFES